MHLDRNPSFWQSHSRALMPAPMRATFSQRLHLLQRALRRLRRSEAWIAALAAAVFGLALLLCPHGARAQATAAKDDTGLGTGKQMDRLHACHTWQDALRGGAIDVGVVHVCSAVRSAGEASLQ